MNSMPSNVILHLLFPFSCYHGRSSFSTGVLLHELHTITMSDSKSSSTINISP